MGGVALLGSLLGVLALGYILAFVVVARNVNRPTEFRRLFWSLASIAGGSVFGIICIIFVASTGIAPRFTRSAKVFDQFQHEEVCTVVFFKPVYGCDVGMVEGGQQLSFASEPCHTVRVLGELVGQNLDCDLSA